MEKTHTQTHIRNNGESQNEIKYEGSAEREGKTERLRIVKKQRN